MAAEREGKYGKWFADDGVGKWKDEHMEANVLYIYRYLSDPKNSKHPTNSAYDFTWTINAIAALCGNIESECHFRPGLKESGSGSGFGLIQWTPGSIHTEWCKEIGPSYGFKAEDYPSMDANLAHIIHEVHQDIQGKKEDGNFGSRWYTKGEYDLTYKEFATSKALPSELAKAFFYERERSAIVLWGFHSNASGKKPPLNGDYCSRSSYDDSHCKNNCMAYRSCYENRYGADATAAQADKNRAIKKKERGDQAIKWYNFIVENTFKGRTDYKVYGDDTNADYKNLYKEPYWVSNAGTTVDGRKGLNYNHAIEKWPEGRAQVGWENYVLGPDGVDIKPKDLIKGTNTVLPNCTSWVYGRIYEILGETPFDFSGCDAGGWWEKAQSDAAKEAGYRTSDTPALGAIMCWQQTSNPKEMGHVAVVEKIFSDGKITFSESGYRTWKFADTGFWNLQKNTTPTSYYNTEKGYTFKGYIHIPLTAIVLPEIESFKLDGEPSTETANFKIKIKTNGSDLSNVVYILDGKESAAKPLKLQATDLEQSFTIEGLVPNTDYNIIIKIIESYGNVLSQPVSFKTKQDYPGPVKKIVISADTHTEQTAFTVTVTPPTYWGYWKDKAKNDYGYRIFLVDNGKLNRLSTVKNENISNLFTVTPSAKNIAHEHNFQVGISTWVTDHRITDSEKQKIFALEGHQEYPICSNSICLKELEEMSDNYFLITPGILGLKPTINKLQAFTVADKKPIKIFILKDSD